MQTTRASAARLRPKTAHSKGVGWAKRTDWRVWTISVIALSAFGPYVTNNIRTDQIVTYASVAILPPLLIKGSKPYVPQVAISIAWLSLLTCAFIGTTAFPASIESVLGSLDNLLAPLAITLICALVLTPECRVSALHRVADITIVGMVANACVVVAQTYSVPTGVVAPWLPRGESTVSDRSATLGRFTGIMNQPALFGVLAGLAMILAIWRLRDRPLILGIVNSALAFSAILSVSKAFFFVSLPVVFIYTVLVLGRKSLPIIAVFGSAILGYWAYAEEFFQVLRELEGSWSGAGLVADLLGQAPTVNAVTGGRYGEESVITPLFDQVVTRSPLYGVGLAGLGAPLDSTWILAFVLGGFLGVICMGLVFATPMMALLHRYKSLPKDEALAYLAILTILVVSSFGFVSVLGNRLAVIAWLIISIMLAAAPATSGSATQPELSKAIHTDAKVQFPAQ